MDRGRFRDSGLPRRFGMFDLEKSGHLASLFEDSALKTRILKTGRKWRYRGREKLRLIMIGLVVIISLFTRFSLSFHLRK